MKHIRKYWNVPVFVVLGWLAGAGITGYVEYWVHERPFNQCVEAKKPVCLIKDRKVYITYR